MSTADDAFVGGERWLAPLLLPAELGASESTRSKDPEPSSTPDTKSSLEAAAYTLLAPALVLVPSRTASRAVATCAVKVWKALYAVRTLTAERIRFTKDCSTRICTAARSRTA